MRKTQSLRHSTNKGGRAANAARFCAFYADKIGRRCGIFRLEKIMRSVYNTAVFKAFVFKIDHRLMREISMTKDLTQGSPVRLILGFALPLLAGMLFQQLYKFH